MGVLQLLGRKHIASWRSESRHSSTRNIGFAFVSFVAGWRVGIVYAKPLDPPVTR
jgi:hypothetical protein